MTEVNLKAITGAFKALAIKEEWCEEAERRFVQVTGVTPLPTAWEERPCGCGVEGCDLTYRKVKQETRFRLPEDAPETVPSQPIFLALRTEARKLYRSGFCCEDCENGYAQEIADLEEIAKLLLGLPKLLA